MKLHYQPITITLLLFFFNTLHSQSNFKNQIDSNSTLAIDTIYEVDTIQVEMDPNLMMISKAHYDSICNELAKKKKENQNEKTVSKEKNRFNLLKSVSLFTADYANMGLKSDLTFSSYFINVSLSTNFNSSLPIIPGVGIGKTFTITNVFSISPELCSFWYLPTQSRIQIQNNQHLLIGLSYKLNKQISIQASPSIYCSWRNNLNSNKEYNDAIHMVSVVNPLYAEETSNNSTFDIGAGISIQLIYSVR